MLAATKPSTPSKPGCLGLLLGALAVPVLALVCLAVLSLFPQGRTLLGRSGTALEILRGQTPSIDLDADSTPGPADFAAAQDKQVPDPIELKAEPEPPAPPPEPATVELGPLSSLPDEIPSQPTWDPVRLFNGVVVETKLVQSPGGIAQTIRNDADAYRAHWQLEVTIPRPAESLADLSSATPELAEQLPGLSALLESARVSRVWHEMYRRKLHGLGSALSNLGEAPYRHNFFDLNAALELRAENGARAFLMQADMDIVSDGSDGDRLPTMPDEIVDSPHYQPTTSYGWAKQGGPPNPIIARYTKANADADKQIAEARSELEPGPSSSSTSRPNAERRTELHALISAQQNRKKVNQRWIDDLKARSYLVAEYDPFVVLPTWMIQWRGQDAEAIPGLGDYAVVFNGGRAYPAIVGDAGPNQKVGEASLRLAREVNPEVSPYRGAVNDLSITYLIFPGSAERPFTQPDYAHWHQRCEELLNDFGGLGEGQELYEWENTFPQ